MFISYYLTSLAHGAFLVFNSEEGCTHLFRKPISTEMSYGLCVDSPHIKSHLKLSIEGL